MTVLREKLQALRERGGFRSQQALADAMGVAKNRVWGYEKGKNLPDVDYLADFAKQVGGDVFELISLRLAAAGHDAQTVVRDEPPDGGYKVPSTLGPLRNRLAMSIMPAEWQTLLTELTLRGKMTVEAAEEIAAFFDDWQPSEQWLQYMEEAK